MNLNAILTVGLLGAALPSQSALAGDGGQDVAERSLRCFSEAHIEVRFSLDPKSELRPQRPTARYIGYRHDESLFDAGLTLTASTVTADAITATLSSGGKKQLTLVLPTSSATSVVDGGGGCFRLRIEKLTGTLTLVRAVSAGGESVPAGPSPVTCLLESQFQSGCE
jgi:hypothetical protein